MSTPHLKIFLKHQPVRVWLWIFAIWAVLEAFCVWLRIGLSIEDVPLKFPISICIISPHLKNWPMLAVFCTIAWLVMKNIRQIKTAGLILFSLLLICSGNLMQGFNGAFLYPLGVETGNTDQYYAEAAGIKISSAEWLADFNENQRDLMTHSRTHPPFAVLLFRELAGAATNDGTCSRWPVLAVWLICTSLCVPMLFEIFHKIGIGINHAKYLAIFLAVMPAFNIYSVLSLDSMIFFLSLFFFHGITDINARGANLENIVAVTISTIAINLLTFGGIFFFVLLLTLAIIRLIRHEK
ncbi:MAG TPA: hypothetical protein PKK48_05495, partial [Phycisphaerae bacterium]|nr:hypothetical protein [Phycisphaerae bacterium]